VVVDRFEQPAYTDTCGHAGLDLFGAYWRGNGSKVVFSGQCFDHNSPPDYCAVYSSVRQCVYVCACVHVHVHVWTYRPLEHCEHLHTGALCLLKCNTQANASICSSIGVARHVTGGIVECLLEDTAFDCPYEVRLCDLSRQ
jgi:hypothetical protein